MGPVVNAGRHASPITSTTSAARRRQDAGKIAGFNVIDIINEPTAATLRLRVAKGELGRRDLAAKEKTIMVYDLGGGTFDVTVVRYTPTQFRVLATDGDVMLGGLDSEPPRRRPHRRAVPPQACPRPAAKIPSR